MSFITNASGEVTLNMGALSYNQNASPFESYYSIFINRQKTGYNINSTGTYQNKSLIIDISNNHVGT